MTDRIKALLEGLARDDHSDRGSLARAITLLESRRPEDRDERNALLDGCDRLIARRNQSSVRVAITGAPGVGKSTLINHLGMRMISGGHRVAVLAVDPSSEVTGGSILGDKTRMAELSREERAFIRPSPTSGHLGGVSVATRETILVCEAAGYDRIIVETVGVGQSEYQVSHLVDAMVFVTMAGAGDGLQGIKRGILESVDLVAVNKADGENRDRSDSHARELHGALKLLRGDAAPACITTSSLSQDGIEPLAVALEKLIRELQASGRFESTRTAQQKRWFDEAVRTMLNQELHARPAWKVNYDRLSAEVQQGALTPYQAAEALIAELFGG